MNQFPMFSSGLELASLVVSSDLLQHSWKAIVDTNPIDPSFLVYSVKDYPPPHNYTILAFVTKQYHLQQETDLVSSATLKERFPLFDFLCTENNPSFSIHKAAISRFASHHDALSLLKNQLLGNSTPLIITGHSLGGSIASLFTLWLLESMDPLTTKRPLCITFGSPFIGDNGFYQSILQQNWNSCFLHVASSQDPVPRSFILPHNPYKPFGTFLLCSAKSGCACFEDPDSIIDLLGAMDLDSATSQYLYAGTLVFDYEHTLEHLKRRILFKGISEGQTGIIAQLEAIGVRGTQNLWQQQGQNIDINTLINKMQRWEVSSAIQKRKVNDATKKLNDVKVYMANLEWYKKASKRIGYYDRYKNELTSCDLDANNYKKRLVIYWKDKVAEAERKPQKKGAAFRLCWQGAGTNYRRMVEPLVIADYYKEGLRDYRTQGRDKHYKKLEQWQKDEEKPNVNSRKSAVSLTEDSCYWADVEEAIISCKLLKSAESSHEEKELSKNSLFEFEKYVMDLTRDKAVSHEIFLEQSTFMLWWKEYKEIIDTSYNSPFVHFMKSYSYQRYA